MKKGAKIIVLSGQSNAVGVGHTAYLSRHFPEDKVEEYRRGYKNVKINYYSHNIKSDGFVPVTLRCAEKGRDTFGPEIGMAEYLTEKYQGEEFFIVKCAFGGSGIACGDWMSPSISEIGSYEQTKHSEINGIRERGWSYNELIHILSESISLLENDGYEPNICGFCWMQGENESFDMNIAKGYIGLYEKLLYDIVGKFPRYFEGCVFADGAIAEHWPLAKVINDSKRDFAAKSADRRFVDTVSAGLTTKNEPESAPDIAHYDSDGVIKLGRMFVEAVGF